MCSITTTRCCRNTERRRGNHRVSCWEVGVGCVFVALIVGPKANKRTHDRFCINRHYTHALQRTIQPFSVICCRFSVCLLLIISAAEATAEGQARMKLLKEEAAQKAKQLMYSLGQGEEVKVRGDVCTCLVSSLCPISFHAVDLCVSSQPYLLSLLWMCPHLLTV
jgi:hypothetical protein